MPMRVTWWSASQPVGAHIGGHRGEFPLAHLPPAVGLRKPDAGHHEAFAMSSPAARSTTVSIVITLRPTRTTDVVVADRVAAKSHHAFDPRARKQTPGSSPGPRVPFGTG